MERGGSERALSSVSVPAGVMVNGLDWICGRSELVATATVCAPTPAFVSPRRMICSSSPGFAKPAEKNVQRVRPAVGCGQLPMSTARVTSRSVPLCQPVVPVPAGRSTVTELPASPDSPPVAETLKPTT